MRKTSEELKEISLQVRRDIIEMIYKAQTGHPGGSLSATEILVAMYFEILGENDKFFFSNDHICPGLYSVMTEKGLIDKNLLSTYAKFRSSLQAHPELAKVTDIMNTSGP